MPRSMPTTPGKSSAYPSPTFSPETPSPSASIALLCVQVTVARVAGHGHYRATNLKTAEDKESSWECKLSAMDSPPRLLVAKVKGFPWWIARVCASPPALLPRACSLRVLPRLPFSEHPHPRPHNRKHAAHTGERRAYRAARADGGGHPAPGGCPAHTGCRAQERQDIRVLFRDEESRVGLARLLQGLPRTRRARERQVSERQDAGGHQGG